MARKNKLDYEVDRKKKSSLQVKAVKALVVFLVVMFLLTVLSRAADSLTIAKVTTQRFVTQAIPHKIEADGSIVANKDIAISVAPGVKIASVPAEEGKTVKKGDVLIQLDTDDLQKKLLQAEKELRVMEAQKSDDAANAAIEEAERQRELQRAQEDNDERLQEAADAVNSARGEMNDAYDEYKRFEGGGEEEEEDDTTVYDALTRAVAEKTAALDAATEALEQLNSEIAYEKLKRREAAVEEQENAVIAARESAEAAEVELDEDELETRSLEDIEDEVNEEVDKEYEEKLKLANDGIEEAQGELADAEAAMTKYTEDQASASDSSHDEQLQELYNAYLEKKEAYEEAQKSYDETKKDIDRSNEDNDTVEKVDTASALTENDEMELKELEVKALQQLSTDEGKVKAPSNGLVTKILVTTGEQTSEDTALRMSDHTSGYKFTTTLDISEAKYLKAGDKMTLKIGDETTIENLPVDSVEASNDDKTKYILNAKIPSKVKKVSNFGSMTIVKESSKYDYCVPLSALHSDGDNYFLYVLGEKSTVLGTEQTASKVDVEILDKNAEYVAVDGFFDWDQQFILTSSKTLNDGDRVRVLDEAADEGDDE